MSDPVKRIFNYRSHEYRRTPLLQVLEVKLGKQMLDKIPVSKHDVTCLNRVLVITLHLACLLTREIPEKGTDEYVTLHKAIYELVRINAKGIHVS